MTKVLVFADSKRQADLLFDSMDELFPNAVGIIHSNKSQNYRFGSLRAFASGQSRILIATDLVARGLDITDVSHVVCFDIPQEAADFIHRIGRTGRADKDGVAIVFATDKEEEALMQVQALMQRQIPMLAIPNGVPMSEVLIEDEKPYIPGIRYTQTDVLKTSQGAFHEKSAKNSKVNLGGSYKRTIKLKFKKPLTRGAKKK